MRNYEAACVFQAEEVKFKAGKEAVQKVLTDLGAQEVKEVDMGVRTLAYPIQKAIQAHYLVFQFQADPAQADQLTDKVKYQEELLRILVTRQED
ncbi:30S ribosomal protein S6 [Spirochaeta lutea]|uniref:30S ribosomal protein S6 n=1 Tax=Spirochaeta lutea TaxID=1480694 RepID=UPI000561ECEE|nr:30S ribosomal protein S6 [Spirochaeta lutea]